MLAFTLVTILPFMGKILKRIYSHFFLHFLTCLSPVSLIFTPTLHLKFQAYREVERKYNEPPDASPRAGFLASAFSVRGWTIRCYRSVSCALWGVQQCS